MKKTRLYRIYFAVLATLVLAGCGGGVGAPENEPVQGGKVVVDFPADTLRQKLIEQKTPGVDANTTVFGYKAYKIVYETEDETGALVHASGLMVVPTDRGVRAEDARKLAYMRQKGFSLVSDSHGTIFADKEAPTAVAEATLAPAGSPILLSALAGFVTLQADYIGFGTSADRYHPYLLKHSSMEATVDFIHAARKFAQKNNIPLNSQLYLTGYSEGGYVALAALQELEQEENVTFAAPMAGPYMMDQMALGVVAQDKIPIPSFIADVAYSYALSYEHNVSELLREPYASEASTLFDGRYTRPQIDERLPKVTEELFTRSAIDGVLRQDPSYWFYGALQLNSTAYWAPKTPTRLLQCLGDDVIPYAMTAGTVNVMKNLFKAPDVEAVPVEVAYTGDSNTTLRLGHAACAGPAYLVVTRMMAEIRKKTIGY